MRAATNLQLSTLNGSMLRAAKYACRGVVAECGWKSIGETCFGKQVDLPLIGLLLEVTKTLSRDPY